MHLQHLEQSIRKHNNDLTAISANITNNYYTKSAIDQTFLKKNQLIVRHIWSEAITCNIKSGSYASGSVSIPQITGYTPIYISQIGILPHVVEYAVNTTGFNQTTINFYLTGISPLDANYTDNIVGFLVLYIAN